MELIVKLDNYNGQYVVSSRMVAEQLGKQHKHVLKSLEEILAGQDFSSLIILSNYKDKQNKSRKQYLLTKDGIKMYLSTCRNITSEQYKKLGIEEVDVVFSHTRFEMSFIDMLDKALKELKIKGIKQFTVDKYKIDYYIPSLNLAIEYDELQHRYQKIEDSQREKNIYKKLGCKFVRVDYEKEDIVNVMKVIKEVYNGIGSKIR